MNYELTQFEIHRILKLNDRLIRNILQKYEYSSKEELIKKYDKFAEKFEFTDIEKYIGHDYIINSFDEKDYKNDVDSCGILDIFGQPIPPDPLGGIMVFIGSLGVYSLYELKKRYINAN
jgi:hypothetical protein